MSTDWTRRGFLAAACAAASHPGRPARAAESSAALAVAGVKPVRTTPFHPWPVIAENDQRAWLDVLRS